MKKKVTEDYELDIGGLKEILAQKLDILPGDIQFLDQKTRTESIPGYDPHDCDYVDRFDGIKFSVVSVIG